MVRLLITGASGQVGRALCARALSEGVAFQACSSADLDITRESKVLRAIRKNKPTCVINAAAYTAVDKAEDEVERCYAVNRDGVRHLAKACARYNVPLLHISTDYVFDGSKKVPYLEDDVPHPLNTYGASKLAGEQELAAWLDRYVVLRVSWVFGESGQNFVKTMTRLSAEREQLSVVEDQWGAPTPAEDIARVLIAIAHQLDCGAKAWGVFHYSGVEIVSWHQFAQTIVDEAKKHMPVRVKEVVPIKTAEYPFRAQRPLNSQLACRKILETFGIKQRSWHGQMERVVQQTCEEINARA